MSDQAERPPSPLRGYRHKKTELNLDLNTQPIENPDREGTSNQATFQSRVDSIVTIDVETSDGDDDDVVVCSPSAFIEAKNKSRRNRGRAIIVDVDSVEETTGAHKRRRVPASQSSIDLELVKILESIRNSEVHLEKPTPPPPPPPLPPPEEPTFSCPICKGPLAEETSTKCGHIFCKACIRAAIASRAKCPTCRKRVTVKQLIRVFLPATNSE